MNKRPVFLVAGGDLRQNYLAGKLSETGKVYTLGLDKNAAVKGAFTLPSVEDIPEAVDYIVFPLPVTNDGVNVNMPFFEEKVSLYSFLPYLKHNAVIFGGKVEKEASIFTYKGFEVIDYLEREELTVQNAIPTSEGAIQIAMEELPTTIFGQKILITGFGRITKVMVKALIGLGAEVYITARKYSDLAWARIFGCEALHISELDGNLSVFDIVFNTVPAVLLDERKLSQLKDGCLVIDLASKPGGVDFETAGRLGIKTIWALSLPGKVAPVTSGEIIAGTILNILSERGEV
ncbi:MAG: dipicolinate synthase subunit DpsA [Oscillospiraceae bacterium]|jgi:dipicolinate synthase subunit A